MNASRVYVPISSDLRHGAPTPRTLNAVYAARVCRGEGVSDGTADHLPAPSDDGPSAYYYAATTPELHAELVRLGAVMQTRGVLA